MPRPQFTLRALLVAMLVVANAIAFYASPLLARRRAIRELDELGAAITYDYQWGHGGAWRPKARAPGLAWLKRLLGENYCVSPVEVQLFTDPTMSPHRFTDKHAIRLAALPELKWLVLMDTQLTDDGLRHLARLSKLERLDLEGTRVAEVAVREFQRSLPNVKVFH
jgi:hypothetical protein